MEGDNERRRSFVNKKTAPYIFLLPMILLFGVFMVYPVIKSLALSFYDFEGGDYLFCGINNYVTMCKDPVFWKSLGNTFIYLAIQVPVMVILSLILGVLVEESFLRFRTCYRVSVFLPSVTALVAYAMIFKLLFNTDFGLVNHILRTFGLGGVDWLNTVWGARAVVIMGITWRCATVHTDEQYWMGRYVPGSGIARTCRCFWYFPDETEYVSISNIFDRGSQNRWVW